MGADPEGETGDGSGVEKERTQTEVSTQLNARRCRGNLARLQRAKYPKQQSSIMSAVLAPLARLVLPPSQPRRPRRGNRQWAMQPPQPPPYACHCAHFRGCPTARSGRRPWPVCWTLWGVEELERQRTIAKGC